MCVHALEGRKTKQWNENHRWICQWIRYNVRLGDFCRGWIIRGTRNFLTTQSSLLLDIIFLFPCRVKKFLLFSSFYFSFYLEVPILNSITNLRSWDLREKKKHTQGIDFVDFVTRKDWKWKKELFFVEASESITEWWWLKKAFYT